MDNDRSLLRAGDLLVVPAHNVNIVPMPKDTLRRVDRIETAALPGISTFNTNRGACFFTNVCGPLPWVIARTPPESFDVYRVMQNILPPEKPETR